MGIFKWIGDTINNFSKEKEETYQWVQDASWSCIYDMLKRENVLSAKAQGLMWALGEKLEQEDRYRLQQFYESEARHSAEKTNPGGFMTLKRVIESHRTY